MNVNVGFIGLGIMGKPMALNLIKGGYPLWVYGRRAGSMAPLTAAGAQACDSPEEVARTADITFIMVSDTQDVEQVILGPKGVLSGASSGAIKRISGSHWRRRSGRGSRCPAPHWRHNI